MRRESRVGGDGSGWNGDQMVLRGAEISGGASLSNTEPAEDRVEEFFARLLSRDLAEGFQARDEIFGNDLQRRAGCDVVKGFLERLGCG